MGSLALHLTSGFTIWGIRVNRLKSNRQVILTLTLLYRASQRLVLLGISSAFHSTNVFFTKFDEQRTYASAGQAREVVDINKHACPHGMDAIIRSPSLIQIHVASQGENNAMRPGPQRSLVLLGGQPISPTGHWRPERTSGLCPARAHSRSMEAAIGS